MKKAIITGATGMIGTCLVNYLLKNDVEVIAIVRDLSKAEKYLPNVHNKLKIIACDMDNILNISLEKDEYDVFYHMAWEGIRGEDRNNAELQKKNITYTLDAVKLAKKIGCKAFIGVGSQEECGKVEGKISSKTIPNPETAYGIAKFSAGKLSRIMANHIGLNHIWVRILSIYGPHDNENTMIMASIREFLKGKSLDYTKAEQLWDYLYIDDMIRALYLIGEKGKNNAIYCVGSGKQQPLYTYIEEIRNQINRKIKLKLGKKEYSKNQIMNLCADISNLTKDTGFIPEIGFKEGIAKTIKWYKEN